MTIVRLDIHVEERYGVVRNDCRGRLSGVFFSLRGCFHFQSYETVKFYENFQSKVG